MSFLHVLPGLGDVDISHLWSRGEQWPRCKRVVVRGSWGVFVQASAFPLTLLYKRSVSRGSIGLGPWFCAERERDPVLGQCLLIRHPWEWHLQVAVLCRGGWLRAAPYCSHEHQCFRLFQNGQHVETCCFPRVLLGRWGTLARDETISSCGEPSVNSLWARCPDPLVFSCQKSSPSSQRYQAQFLPVLSWRPLMGKENKETKQSKRLLRGPRGITEELVQGHNGGVLPPRAGCCGWRLAGGVETCFS